MDISQWCLIPFRANSKFLYLDKSFYNLASAHFSKLISCHTRSPLFLLIQVHQSFLGSPRSFPAHIILLASTDFLPAVLVSPCLVFRSQLQHHWPRRFSPYSRLTRVSLIDTPVVLVPFLYNIFHNRAYLLVG